MIPTNDELDNLDVRLKFLSHDARDVVTRSEMRDDMRLREQVHLVELCYNYSPERVFRVIRPSDKAIQRRGERTSDGATFKNQFSLLQVVPTLRLKGKAIHDVHLSPQAIWNLYLADGKFLVSDWTVRLEALAELFGKISVASLEDVMAECNYPRLNALMSDVEAFFGAARETADTLAHAKDPTIDEPRPVKPEVVAGFEAALREFEETKE